MTPRLAAALVLLIAACSSPRAPVAAEPPRTCLPSALLELELAHDLPVVGAASATIVSVGDDVTFLIEHRVGRSPWILAQRQRPSFCRQDARYTPSLPASLATCRVGQRVVVLSLGDTSTVAVDDDCAPGTTDVGAWQAADALSLDEPRLSEWLTRPDGHDALALDRMQTLLARAPELPVLDPATMDRVLELVRACARPQVARRAIQVLFDSYLLARTSDPAFTPAVDTMLEAFGCADPALRGRALMWLWALRSRQEHRVDDAFWPGEDTCSVACAMRRDLEQHEELVRAFTSWRRSGGHLQPQRSVARPPPAPLRPRDKVVQ